MKAVKINMITVSTILSVTVGKDVANSAISNSMSACV